MSVIKGLYNKILAGEALTTMQAESLVQADLEELCGYANRLREHYCKNTFDICTIVNAKSGKCSENCKYCAQSARFSAGIDEYLLLPAEKLIATAMKNKQLGILRYSVVTSGRALSDVELDEICKSYVQIKKEVGISLCASHGLLTYEQLRRLKAAGVERYHNNLETSENYFPKLCTTHSYSEKIDTIKAAQRAGLQVCSGGIIGAGEGFDDRISMAVALRELGIRSIPINRFTPIKGTALGDIPQISQDEFTRTIAVFRFINPRAAIRAAAGRGTMEDRGKKLFESGANAAISGDMLTTSGISTKEDLRMLAGMGYKIEKL